MELAQIVVALVRDGHPALVRVDGAEGEILRRRLALGQHVEEGGLPVVGRNTQRARKLLICYIFTYRAPPLFVKYSDRDRMCVINQTHFLRGGGGGFSMGFFSPPPPPPTESRMATGLGYY